MKPAMPSVTYRKPVSDTPLKLFLERIANVLGASINVHSGDRTHRPQGSPSKSLHLRQRAADFHVSGVTDRRAFETLLAKRRELADQQINRFQVIYHGPHTETEGEHLHIGDYALIKAVTLGPGISFLTEGLSPETKGKYKIVP